ncbi:hypothetical protein GGI20_002286 [Coemansia sp. BCRC 34301]|nr:hypothetical protein GGI20_002286 [Coemansia sp. BCRC 34301]
MRYFSVLVVLGSLLALSQAAKKDYREITLKNKDGIEETYDSNDLKCHRVSRKYHGTPNYALAKGGPVRYYEDSECKKWVLIDTIGKNEFVATNYRIKAYRAVREEDL